MGSNTVTLRNLEVFYILHAALSPSEMSLNVVSIWNPNDRISFTLKDYAIIIILFYFKKVFTYIMRVLDIRFLGFD